MESGNNINILKKASSHLALLRKRNILTKEELEELECHLLDQIEDLVSRGMNHEEALHRSLKQMGEASLLVAEFYKQRSFAFKWGRPVFKVIATKKAAAFSILFIGIAFSSIFAERSKTSTSQRTPHASVRPPLHQDTSMTPVKK